MDIALPSGRYVVAVSGGVDSVVLLHILHRQPGLQLTVAHYDHGIRTDSREDRKLVQKLAQQYGLPFVYSRAELGADASEDMARQARYEFLHKVRTAASADAVITAHQRDDVLETAVLNIIRGTGRKGLTSLQSTDIVKRPLLHVPKQQIVRYARDNQLLWREDSTNLSDIYRRNYVRHKLLARFGSEQRDKFYSIITELRQSNENIDTEVRSLLDSLTAKEPSGVPSLDRSAFIMLPHAVAREIMAGWLRQNDVKDIDRKMLERLVHACKTFAIGRRAPVNEAWIIIVKKAYLALERNER